MIEIRRAELSDLDGITEIYNEAIERTVATFDTEPKGRSEQEGWFAQHGDRYPIIVAVLGGSGMVVEGDGEEEIIGWASLSQWSDRCAYSDTAEISLYVMEQHQGKGVGKLLMRRIIDAGRKAGLHSVLARIADGNEVSVHLHEQVGFELVGIMKEVGRKFGRMLDVHLMQLIYDVDNGTNG